MAPIDELADRDLFVEAGNDDRQEVGIGAGSETMSLSVSSSVLMALAPTFRVSSGRGPLPVGSAVSFEVLTGPPCAEPMVVPLARRIGQPCAHTTGAVVRFFSLWVVGSEKHS